MTAYLPNDDLHLDAWLEAQSGGTSPSPNGTTPHSPEALVSVARQFHAALLTAEQRAVPDIPARRIWEDVMRNTAPLGTVAIPFENRNGATPPPPNRPHDDAFDSPWAKPGHWLVPTLLCAAVLIGILAVYANFFDDNPAAPPTSAPGLAFGSPEATASTPSASCDVAPLTQDEITLIQQTGITDPPREYGPTTSVNAPLDEEIRSSYDRFVACHEEGNWRPMASDRLILEAAVFGDPRLTSTRIQQGVRPGDTTEEAITFQQEMAALFLTGNLSDYVITSHDVANPRVLEPEDVVQLPDGRVGGPVTQYSTKTYPDDSALVEVFIFSNTSADRGWVVDQFFMLCVGECDPYYEYLRTGVLPPEKLATPDTSIDEWLVYPDDVACPPAPAGSTPVALNSYPDDLPMPVKNYLPLGPADGSDQRTIAERFLTLNLGCPVTESDPVRTGDFSWMPGPSVTPATADQIATAQQVSAALPMQDYRDYYIVRPPGESQESAGQTILLPEDVVQLPDGRLGAPLRILIQSDNPDATIDNLTQGHDMAPSAFMIFEQVDGQWLYDELFMLCIGDCDAYWAMAAGELPVPVACDTTPRTTEEIRVIERAEFLSAPAREYGPTSPLESPLTDEISTAYDRYTACSNQGEWRSTASNRLIQESATLGDPNAASMDVQGVTPGATSEESIAFQQEMAALFLTGNRSHYVVETDDMRGTTELRRLEPENVVQLADGRVGGPITSYLSVGSHNDPYGYSLVEVAIFSNDRIPNTWDLDETFQLCIGNCEPYYEYLRTGIQPTGTPAATSEADGDAFWLELQSSANCDVQPLPLEEAQSIREQSSTVGQPAYLPIAPVDDDTAMTISATGRNWLACVEYGEVRTHEALETDAFINATQRGFIWLSNPEWYLANSDEVRALSEQVIDPDPSTYWVEANPPLQPDEAGGMEFTDTMLPEHAVTLADGRIGFPISQLDPLGGETTVTFTEPFQLIRFVILAPHSDRPGTWLVDETLPLCSGQCDTFWSDPATVLKLYGLISAETYLLTTPAAVQVDSWMQPVVAAECNVPPVTLDEANAIVNATPTTISSRSYDVLGPADAPSAEAASTANRIWQSCRLLSDPLDYMAVQSQQLTTEFTSIGEQSASFAAYQSTHPEALLDLLDPDPMTYFQLRSTEYEPSPSGSLWLINPDHVVQFSDGRLGAPASEFLPQWYLDDMVRRDSVPPIPFVFFVQNPDHGGSWLIDEIAMLCPEGCTASDTFHTAATPVATPTATDHWLIDMSKSACPKNETDPFPADIAFTAPGPAENYLPFGEQPPESLRMQVASTYQRLQGNCAPLSPDDTLVSQDLAVFQVPSTDPDATPVTRQQVDTAMAIAAAFDTGDPLDWIVEGPALPPGASEGGPMGSFRHVILPESVVQLPDGRVAAPSHIYLQTNDPDGAAGWFGDRQYIDVFFYVFDPTVPGMPMDEVITICLGDCDAYWASYTIATEVGTPVATPATTPANAAPVTRRRSRRYRYVPVVRPPG